MEKYDCIQPALGVVAEHIDIRNMDQIPAQNYNFFLISLKIAKTLPDSPRTRSTSRQIF